MSNAIRTVDLSTAKVDDKLWDSWKGEWVTLAGLYPTILRRGNGQILQYVAYRYFWQPFEVPQECLTRVEHQDQNNISEIHKIVGDSVWSILHQEWGKVIEPSSGATKIALSSTGSHTWVKDSLLTFEKVEIPDSARVRPANPPEGTKGWGRESLDGVWMIGYLFRNKYGMNCLARDPHGRQFLQIDEFTTEDPYAKESLAA